MRHIVFGIDVNVVSCLECNFVSVALCLLRAFYVTIMGLKRLGHFVVFDGAVDRLQRCAPFCIKALVFDLCVVNVVMTYAIVRSWLWSLFGTLVSKAAYIQRWRPK